MSNTRSITECLSKGLISIKNTLQLKPGEGTKLLLPIAGCIGVAGVYSFPSVAYVILTESILPDYTLKATFVGAMFSSAWIAYDRFKNNGEVAAEISSDKAGYVSLIKLNGEISSNNIKMKGSFSADSVMPLLQAAFTDNKSKGVVIKINSPGGSPVQSSLIYAEIMKLKAKHNKKVVVLGEDCMASGAYYIAMSADKIYVNANTITGSIGVISSDYGYADFGQKVGVESRIHTAGKNKCRHDPLKPEKAEDIAKLEESLNDIHSDFKSVVLKGREGKLKENEEILFTGDAWTGKKALQLGLVDEIGTLTDLMEKEFQVTNFKEVKEDWKFNFSLSQLFSPMLNSNVDVSLNLPANGNGIQLKYQG